MCRSCSVRVQWWRRQPSSHSNAVLHGHWRCTCPSLCNDSCRVVQTAENCEGPAVAVLLNVVDVPVLQVHLSSSSPWTRSLTCPLLSTTVVLLSVEVQFIARLRGHCCCATRDGYAFFSSGFMAAVKGVLAVFPHFSRSSGLSRS